MGDYDWVQAIGPIVGAIGKGISSSQTVDEQDRITQEAVKQALANLGARMGDYDALGSAGYQNIVPQEVGDTALAGIAVDPRGKMAQEESLAALEELAANGGLSLADMAALNEVQRNLNRNNSARQKGLANEFAARGQLGSGAQLAMGLAGQQNAAENANQRGESVAAQAQARALQAILQKGQVARGMTNDDYGRKSEAAKARDLIEARNAAARTDAAKANNAIAGQGFANNLSKARGKTSLTNSMNDAVFGGAAASRNTAGARGSIRNNVIDNGVSAWGSMAGGNNSQTSGTPVNDGGLTTDEEEQLEFNDDDLGD